MDGAGLLVTVTSASAALVVRPHKVRVYVIPVAVALVVVFAVVALLLKSGSTGVEFDGADQFSLLGIGIVLALGSLVFIRPRLVADADGVEVRNALFGQKVPWSLVRAVSFPDGAPWARLELPQDEYVPVVAIQAADGARAVAAIRELRALHRKYSVDGVGETA
jgi:Bacterial PH domain